MIFYDKPVATITCRQVGASEKLNLPGVTTASITPENAVAQINKILAIVGREAGLAGMTRTRTEEAINNG